MSTLPVEDICILNVALPQRIFLFKSAAIRIMNGGNEMDLLIPEMGPHNSRE